MATLFDSVVDEAKVYKGASRVVIGAATGDGGPSFPSKIEDVINVTTFVLASGWTDIGATTRDGAKLTRTVEMEEGVETDQLAVAILKGYPKKWEGQVAFTWLHSDVESLKIAFEGVAPAAVAGSQGSQKEMKFGSPVALTERQVCIIQKHNCLFCDASAQNTGLCSSPYILSRDCRDSLFLGACLGASPQNRLKSLRDYYR